MKRPDEFERYIVEDVMGEIPDVTSRAMFSGFGIYKKGIIFAIIAEGELYFKVDEKNEGDYKVRGSRPFRYPMKNGRVAELSYWLLPEEIMENREELPGWIDAAVAATKRAKKKKR